MTDQWTAGTAAGTTSTGSGQGTTPAEGAKEAAGQAMAQASAAVDEAKVQVRELVTQATSEARTQADAQAQRAADGMRTLAEQLQALLDGRPEQAGRLPDLARQASGELQRLAERIGSGGVDGINGDVRTFARRRPGAFLAGAAALGFAAGRFLRGAQSATQAPPTQASPASTTPSPMPGAGVSYGAATTATTGEDVVVLEAAEPTTEPIR